MKNMQNKISASALNQELSMDNAAHLFRRLKQNEITPKDVQDQLDKYHEAGTKFLNSPEESQPAALKELLEVVHASIHGVFDKTGQEIEGV